MAHDLASTKLGIEGQCHAYRVLRAPGFTLVHTSPAGLIDIASRSMEPWLESTAASESYTV